MNLKEALAKIEELEEEIADLELEIDGLEQDAERANDPLYDSDDVIEIFNPDPEALETLDPYIFLRDIGLDPWKLPSSVGERMDIRKRLESPIPDLSEKLEECQEQYGYLEQHYNRAWELGYDPITKDFYCKACSRAGRED